MVEQNQTSWESKSSDSIVIQIGNSRSRYNAQQIKGLDILYILYGRKSLLRFVLDIGQLMYKYIQRHVQILIHFQAVTDEY